MRLRIFFLFGFLYFLSCGKEEKNKVSVPYIEYAYILPKIPKANELLKLVYSVSDKKAEVKIEWYLNNKKIGTGDTCRLVDVRKGDKIYAVITPYFKNRKGKVFKTEEIVIKNSSPVVEFAKFEPEKIFSNTKKIRVIPRGYDPDGDEIKFFARWRINRLFLRDSSLEISLDNIKAGDTIEALVYAYDNESRSYKGYDLETVVLNSPPEINDEPSVFYKNKKIFVKFNIYDPDGDKVKMEILFSNTEPIKVLSDSFYIIFPYEEEVNDISLIVRFTDKAGNYVDKEVSLKISKN